ncbi:MAG: lysine--tRNA ligase [Flammeovirgaceae bacterium]|nr:lysine--tRNA ligase [Flammeovirgaceae bacterium]|tara:strand:- start:7408 stop:8928 length:1521 start_codon:yes stop_codon:yes gene_type:complete
MNLSEQEEQRRKSREEIIELGIDPYPSDTFDINTNSQEIKDDFDEKKKNFQDVSISGRIMSRRVMGSASFAEIQDSKGKIQIYVRRDDICDGEDKTLYNTIFKKKLDLGDIIGITGYVFKTQMGETTIHVTSLKVLSKSVRPLPVVKESTDEKGDSTKHDVFSNKELKYRRRYIDLIVNPESREIFRKRSSIINEIRNILNEKNFLEVETPILQPIYGGASARPFKTFHNTLDIPLYLRIANELYLKRLIVGGFEGVFEFAKDFRNEGMSRFHNPEFTQCEFYVAYKDYVWMMDFIEDMFKRIVKKVCGSTKVSCGENKIDFEKKWERYSMYEAIKKFTSVDVSKMDEDSIRKVCKDMNVKVDKSMGRGKLIDEIFGEKCEPNLIQPTYITDYPIEMSPLAKKHRDKEGLVERFELICNGKEICNAFSEINDPIDQRERFEEQVKLGNRGDEEAMVIDEDYLTALEYGMPPTAGIGIGIDRLTMILTNSDSIQDVLFFPQMKPENS